MGKKLLSENNLTFERKSGIELLKCIAILLVIISHIVPHTPYNRSFSFIDLNRETDNLSLFICTFYTYCGQIGNAIFVVCSSYFLINSNTVKPLKVINMIAINWSISFIMLIIFLIFSIDITISEIKKSLFPSIYTSCWFVSCYIVFYLIHPFLNQIINNMNKRQLLTSTLIMTLLYCGIQTIIPGTYFYNSLTGFIVIYFITAYMKYYLTDLSASLKLNIRAAAISVLLLIALISITNILKLKMIVYYIGLSYWCRFTNPLIIVFSLSIFNIFNRMEIHSKAINYLSSLSLKIYIIHDNLLVMSYTLPYVFNMILKYVLNHNISYENNVWWISLSLAVITFLLSIIVSAAYNLTIERVIKFIVKKVYDEISPAVSKQIDKICRIK